ncbi:MAG: hypothetical protein RJA70_4501, partial [Pseudomonadota bacterium]
MEFVSSVRRLVSVVGAFALLSCSGGQPNETGGGNVRVVVQA